MLTDVPSQDFWGIAEGAPALFGIVLVIIEERFADEILDCKYRAGAGLKTLTHKAVQLVKSFN